MVMVMLMRMRMRMRMLIDMDIVPHVSLRSKDVRVVRSITDVIRMLCYAN